ncbi:hypothetical protein [Cellvibrio sp. PSBB006]|nr:hypothetical protein [Cellvibrio sp. PSBB006]
MRIESPRLSWQLARVSGQAAIIWAMILHATLEHYPAHLTDCG